MNDLNKEALISVIVPVYNVDKYLAKCVESIIQQTYKNLEIILVNDGSQDNSAAICEHYRHKDVRITVIHQENKGISVARNRGLDIATGALLSFIDSDDFIHPRMFETLKKFMDSTNADISMCNYQAVFENQSPVQCQVATPGHCTFDNIEALKRYFSKDHFKMVVVWNKLYKSHLYATVRFPEGKFH